MFAVDSFNFNSIMCYITYQIKNQLPNETVAEELKERLKVSIAYCVSANQSLWCGAYDSNLLYAFAVSNLAANHLGTLSTLQV